MTFVTTWLAVAGIGAMAAPIIIHLLFRRRRQPVMWGAMQLLLEAIRRHRRRARVEQILLLTIRCLILLLIGLALAEPILAGIRALGSGSRMVVFVIDDGLVSGIQNESGSTELKETIGTANKLLDQLNSGDRVAVVRASFPAREVTDGPTVDLERIRRLLNEITPQSGETDIPSALETANKVLDEHAAESPSTVVLLGSWRRGSFGADDLNESSLGTEMDSAGSDDRSRQLRELLTVTPTTTPKNVIAIESIKLRRPVSAVRADQPPIRTTVSLRRMGNDLSESQSVVRLSGAGIEESLPRQIQFGSGSSRAVIEFTGRTTPSNATADGTSSIVAQVDDPALQDVSRRSAIVDTSPTIQVGIIDRNEFSTGVLMEEIRSSEWIERALEPDVEGVIEVDQIDPAGVTERALRGLDAVIVGRPDLLTNIQWETIRDFVSNGHFVLVTPPTDLQVHSWLDQMAQVFGLDWQVDLEVTEFENPVGLVAGETRGSLLSMLGSELDVLTTPITIKRSLSLKSTPGDATTILESTEKVPILVSWEGTTERRGTLALLTVAPHLSWTSLPVKPLMVPLLQELIREGAAAGQGSTALVAGDYANIPITGAREITGPGGKSIPVDLSGGSIEPIRQVGQWIARDTNGSALSTVVVNPNIDAADPTLVSTDAFTSWLGSPGSWQILEDEALVDRFNENQGNPIFSILLLGIALLLVVLETALNRWFSRAQVSRSSIVSTGGVA